MSDNGSRTDARAGGSCEDGPNAPSANRPPVNMRRAWSSWQVLGRSGAIAPELPSVLFIATTSGAGFWCGLAAGCVSLVLVLIARVRETLPTRTVLGATVSLGVAASVARVTGIAAGAVLVDAVVDLVVAVVLVASVLIRRPAFGVLWGLGHHEPLRAVDPLVRQRHMRTTAFAATALAVRACALGALWFGHAPDVWLLALKIVLGIPVTLVVIAAAYVAGAPASHGPARTPVRRISLTPYPEGKRTTCTS